MPMQPQPNFPLGPAPSLPGPPGEIPTVSPVEYPGAVFLPTTNEAQLPFIFPIGNGAFLYYNQGQLYLRTAAGRFPVPGGGGSSGQVVVVTAAGTPYAVQPTDTFIFVDTSAGAVTVTLEAAPVVGREVIIKKISTDTNVLTIARNGNAIEGSAADLTTASTGRPSYTLAFENNGGGWWWIV